MSNEAENGIIRWRDREPGVDLLEDRAAALVRGAPAPDEPDAVVLARVERRLLRPASRGARSKRWVLRVALALVALVAGGASVKAFEWVRQSSGLWPRDPLPGASPAPAGKKHARVGRPVLPVTPPPVPTPAAAVGSPTTPALPSSAGGLGPVDEHPSTVRPRRSVTGQARTASAPPAPALAPPGNGATPSPAFAPSAVRLPPSPSAPAPSTNDEIAALDRAMALLRRDRDAAAALVALDAYLQRYPGGFLEREALAGRIDALLVLGQEAQALHALDGFPFDRHRRSTELRVIRAELRARADCARAVADFGEALAGGPDAALLGRILYGRGTCRAKTGDVAGATADLGRYVERFPDGEHAASARRWLVGRAGQQVTGGPEDR